MMAAIVVPLGRRSKARTASFLFRRGSKPPAYSEGPKAFSRRFWRAQSWSLWGFCCAAGGDGTTADTTEAPQWHNRQRGRIEDQGQRPSLGTGNSDALFAAE